MKRKFWQWVHDRLEKSWQWVYFNKLRTTADHMKHVQNWKYVPVPGAVPLLNDAEVVGVEYWRINPDGTYTLMDGPTDTAVIR